MKNQKIYFSRFFGGYFNLKAGRGELQFLPFQSWRTKKARTENSVLAQVRGLPIFLKQELDADLSSSGVIVLVGRGDCSKGGRGRVYRRCREVRFVERVAKFETELQPYSFVDLRIL